MLRVETNAETLAEIQKVIQSQEGPKSVRIFVAGYGCGGPSLGLALDEVKEADFSQQQGEVNFVIDKELFENLGDIKVEFVGNGYLVQPVEMGESGCGGCGGGCGHGH